MKTQTMHPHDLLCAAIGILQDNILARDTTANQEMMFGHYRMKTASLELVERILVDLLDVTEEAAWR